MRILGCFHESYFSGLLARYISAKPAYVAITEEEEPRAKALLGWLVQGAEAPC